MKKIAALILAVFFTITAFSCATGKASALNKVVYNEKGNSEYFYDAEYFGKLSAFSNKIYVDCAENENKNYVMSPISLYMAFSVLYSAADENIKGEIETLFGMTGEDIAKTGDLFIKLISERKNKGKLISKLNITNSIWLDTDFDANEAALKRLAEDFYCYAYKTPFESDNKAANKAIRKFIKDKTNGLIDKDFDLDPDTLFAIINTLYFKDIWIFNDKLAVEKRDFYIGEEPEMKDFLIGKYFDGKVKETENAEYFYTRTASGYYVKFILPKEGVSLKDAMTAENLNIINSAKYSTEEEAEVRYFTRCIFPKFKIESDTPVKDILERKGYLGRAFFAFNSDLTEQELFVSDIKHSAVINIDEQGVEGAAVTIISNKGTAMPPEQIKQDFVLDRNFGFIITDVDGVVLFEGQVVNP